MNKVRLCLAAMCFISSPCLRAAVHLAIGEQKSFPVAAGARFSVGNGEVIQVKVTHLVGGKSLLIVKGKSQGYSDLVILSDAAAQTRMDFRVLPKRQAAMATDASRVVSAPKGLDMVPQADGWILRGKTKNLDDWNLAQLMEERSKGKVRSLVGLHPLERLRAEQKIWRLLRRAGYQHLRVVGIDSLILVQGEVASARQKELAERLMKSVMPSAQSQITVPFEAGGSLRFRAKILEVLKGSEQALGLQWSDSSPGAITITKNLTKAQLGIEAGLKFLERNGSAKVISQPELFLNERGLAELRVGGEIPVESKTRYSAQVQWRPYGLQFKLELQGMSAGFARTKIEVDISSLDPANSRDGVPAFRRSHMETVADIGIGRPILLSGLMERRNSEMAAQFPGLGDVPILGELFKSRDFQANRSELVIFLEAVSRK